jgi:hypothetical protein
MSEFDNDVPRDPETGQFTSLGDHYRQEHARLEYTPLPDEKEREETAPQYGSSDEEIRAAARETVERRGREIEAPIEVAWYKRGEDGNLTDEKLDRNVSTTIDQAATALSEFRGQNDAINELSREQDLVDAVDKARAEANGQATVDRYASAETPAAPTAEPTPQATPTADGLDPAVAAALQHPQIREAVQQEISEAVQAKQQYSAAIDQANNFAQASLIEHLPELARLDKSQWETAILTINTQDPQRVQRAMNTISRVQQLSAEQARIANERAQQMQAQTKAEVERFSRSEDARFKAYAERENLNVPEMGRAATEYFHRELGVSPESLKLLVDEVPALRSAAFQRLIVDAVRYNQGKTARQNLPKTLPPAPLRPGSQVAAPAASYNSGKIAGLERALAGATGHAAIKIAAQITSLKRKG